MSESVTVRGTIQYIPNPRQFTRQGKVTTYYSVKVNDVYYSVGSKKPPEVGTLVEFEAGQNEKGYWDVLKPGLRVVTANPPTSNVGGAAVRTAKTSVISKDDYWKRKEERDIQKEAAWEQKDKIIQLQSCRNSAIEFVKLLLTQVPHEDKNGNVKLEPSLKLPAAIAKREAILFEAVKKYTEEFVNENNNNYSEKNKTNEQLPDDDQDPTQEVGQTATEDDEDWIV